MLVRALVKYQCYKTYAQYCCAYLELYSDLLAWVIEKTFRI